MFQLDYVLWESQISQAEILRYKQSLNNNTLCKLTSNLPQQENFIVHTAPCLKKINATMIEAALDKFDRERWLL